MYSSSMSVGDYYPMNGSLVSTVYPSDVLANPDLKWETARQFGVGVDARFLNNRLTFGMDFYNKNTVDQILTLTPPLATGTTSMARNMGKVNNHGFEFELGPGRDQVGEFTYGVNANLATISSEVKEMEGARIVNDLSDFVYFDKGQPIAGTTTVTNTSVSIPRTAAPSITTRTRAARSTTRTRCTWVRPFPTLPTASPSTPLTRAST